MNAVSHTHAHTHHLKWCVCAHKLCTIELPAIQIIIIIIKFESINPNDFHIDKLNDDSMWIISWCVIWVDNCVCGRHAISDNRSMRWFHEWNSFLLNGRFYFWNFSLNGVNFFMGFLHISKCGARCAQKSLFFLPCSWTDEEIESWSHHRLKSYLIRLILIIILLSCMHRTSLTVHHVLLFCFVVGWFMCLKREERRTIVGAHSLARSII